MSMSLWWYHGRCRGFQLSEGVFLVDLSADAVVAGGGIAGLPIDKAVAEVACRRWCSSDR